MRIAIFDYRTTRTNPVGSCNLRIVQSLCHEHDFTVFAPQFENPDPSRIRHVRIRVPLRPLALLFVAFHLLAPVYYWWDRLRTGKRFDLVQMVESNILVRRDVDYVQFCHRRFLRDFWPSVKGKGSRSFLRFWDHKLHAIMEPIAFKGAGTIVVPSKGTGRELTEQYPFVASKLRVIYNPVDLEAFRKPVDFDSAAERARLKLGLDDIVMVFVALGHFERKGLPLILAAMAAMRRPELKLIVVGGEAGLIADYEGKVRQMGLESHVQFLGVQRDVRPSLWLSDAFVLPSSYEAFPLVALQAAGAGTPAIVSPLNGVEEFAIDGVNSIVVERTAQGVQDGIERFLQLSPNSRKAMGKRVQQDVSPFSADRFDAGWRALYSGTEVPQALAAVGADLHRGL
jgi:glycosyltransferase involved in cell wall biosynthesis